MPVKAIFFDWYNTLAQYDPPLESLHVEACRSYGINLDPEMLRVGLAEADKYIYEENVREKLNSRSPKERVEIFTCYEDKALSKAGANVPRGMALPIYMKVRDMRTKAKFALYSDVLPTMAKLRIMSVTTGLISNIEEDISGFVANLGLKQSVDFIVTPREAHAEKPNPQIFKHALARANVAPSEAVHVGDQYYVDVIGARDAGIQPVLLDRHNISPDADCMRIVSLDEILTLL